MSKNPFDEIKQNNLNFKSIIPGLSFGDSNKPCIICKKRKTMGIASNGKERFALCAEHWDKVWALYNGYFYRPIGVPYRILTIDLLKIINDLFRVLEKDFPLLKESEEYKLIKRNIMGEDPLNWFGCVEKRDFVFCPYCGKKIEKYKEFDCFKCNNWDPERRICKVPSKQITNDKMIGLCNSYDEKK